MMNKEGILFSFSTWLTVVIFCVYAEQGPCKSCDDEVKVAIQSIASRFNKSEPVKLNSSFANSPCKQVTVKGLWTLKSTGKSCISTGDDGIRYQRVNVRFSNVSASCSLKSISEIRKIIKKNMPTNTTKKAKGMISSTTKFLQSNSERHFKVSWKKMDIQIVMNLSNTTTVDSVNSTILHGGKFSEMKMSCSGDPIFKMFCDMVISKPQVKDACDSVVPLVMNLCISQIVISNGSPVINCD